MLTPWGESAACAQAPGTSHWGTEHVSACEGKPRERKMLEKWAYDITAMLIKSVIIPERPKRH